MSNDELLRALVRQDLVRANEYLAGYPELCGKLTLDQVSSSRVIEAAPVWRIEPDGTSRFRFHVNSWRSVPELIFSRWLAMLPLIASVIAVAKPGRCWFSLGDEAHRPGLAFCGNLPEHILVPDPYFMNSHGYEELRDAFARTDVQWGDRSAVAFWRGTTTGPYHVPLEELPRVSLCRLAQSMGKRADVGLSSVTENHSAKISFLESEGIIKDFVALETLDRYQVHIDIDGNSNSWPGLMSKLHSGGAVMKVDSEQNYRQWYYDRLEPWVHFVPVRADLSDFVAKAELLLSNPILAEKIGRAGQNLARQITVEAEIKRINPVVVAAFEPI